MAVRFRESFMIASLSASDNDRLKCFSKKLVIGLAGPRYPWNRHPDRTQQALALQLRRVTEWVSPLPSVPLKPAWANVHCTSEELGCIGKQP